jgi:hypothetical protein
VNHRVQDCVRPIKLEKGTASYPKAKKYQQMKVAGLELSSEGEEDSDSECSESSKSLESSDSSDSRDEISEGEYLDEEKDDQQQQEEEGNWWDSPPDSDSDTDSIRQATLRLQVAN